MVKHGCSCLISYVTFVLRPQSYCSRLAYDGTSAWAELVLWTHGCQSGHYSVSISLCWIELTSSKFEIFGSSVREFGKTQKLFPTRVHALHGLSWFYQTHSSIRTRCLNYPTSHLFCLLDDVAFIFNKFLIILIFFLFLS